MIDVTYPCINCGDTKSCLGCLSEEVTTQLELPKQEQSSKKCTCEIVLLMQEGCSCGAIEKHKPGDIR